MKCALFLFRSTGCTCRRILFRPGRRNKRKTILCVWKDQVSKDEFGNESKMAEWIRGGCCVSPLGGQAIFCFHKSIWNGGRCDAVPLLLGQICSYITWEKHIQTNFEPGLQNKGMSRAGVAYWLRDWGANQSIVESCLCLELSRWLWASLSFSASASELRIYFWSGWNKHNLCCTLTYWTTCLPLWNSRQQMQGSVAVSYLGTGQAFACLALGRCLCHAFS